MDPGVPSPPQGHRPALHPLHSRLAQDESLSPRETGEGSRVTSTGGPTLLHAPPPPPPHHGGPPPLGRCRHTPGQRDAGRLLPCALPRESVSGNFSRRHVLGALTTTTTTTTTTPPLPPPPTPPPTSKVGGGDFVRYMTGHWPKSFWPMFIYGLCSLNLQFKVWVLGAT